MKYRIEPSGRIFQIRRRVPAHGDNIRDGSLRLGRLRSHSAFEDKLTKKVSGAGYSLGASA
jgi:hypothetical protein